MFEAHSARAPAAHRKARKSAGRSPGGQPCGRSDSRGFDERAGRGGGAPSAAVERGTGGRGPGGVGGSGDVLGFGGIYGSGDIYGSGGIGGSRDTDDFGDISGSEDVYGSGGGDPAAAGPTGVRRADVRALPAHRPGARTGADHRGRGRPALPRLPLRRRHPRARPQPPGGARSHPRGPRLGRPAARPRPRDAGQGRLHDRTVRESAGRAGRGGPDPVLRARRDRRGGGRAETRTHRHRQVRAAGLHRGLPRHDRGRVGGLGRGGGRTRDPAAVPAGPPLPLRGRRARGRGALGPLDGEPAGRPQERGGGARGHDRRTGPGRGRRPSLPGRLAAQDAGDHGGPRNPADRRRGPDGGWDAPAPSGASTTPVSCPT
ncbi:hypothetical protein SAVIM338S_05448 [Streptomyces avidinii]